MAGGQQEGNSGKRGRDAALTWDVPPPLEEAEKAAPAGRPAFSAVAAKHLEALVAQLLEAEGVAAADMWGPIICDLAQQAAAALSPTAAVAFGKLDPRFYVKVKRLVSLGADPADSAVVQGIACRKSLAHKRMRSSILQPRIMLLAGGVEPHLPSSAGNGAGASKLSSFDALLDQEQQHLAAAVERIASYSPDVLLVERSVARYAQELLLARDVSLVLNVKRELLERLARCTGALVAPSLDQLTSHCIGHCKAFEVESLQAAAPTTTVSTAAPSTDASPRSAEPPEGHLIADAAALRRAAAAGAAHAPGSLGGGGPRALMLFRGCPRQLGCTILLRGSDAAELRRVKRVTSFAAYAAYWGGLEAALLSDQLAAAAAAVLPGSETPDALAGLADAVASTSFLATAEARGRQAILSASAHVSLVLEKGAPTHELEVLDRQEQRQRASSDAGSGGELMLEEELAEPDSPDSSDSTSMWVLPAEAGTATFTVSGSQSQLGLDHDPEAAARQHQQLGGGSEASTPLGGGSATSPTASMTSPMSPQDPLHQAAKELALRQLQLTGSEPPSPATSGMADTPTTLRRGALGPFQQQQEQQQEEQEQGGPPAGLESQGTAPQLSRPASLVSSLTAEAAAGTPGRGDDASAPSSSPSPGTLIYGAQQLWLAISCKNPEKQILCEPAHAHCMDFYADTDLPLAAFISAAAPPNRKCPHPQCGEGAPLHLRSFMHGSGLVTLSSVRLPAGKALPDGRVWLWLRPTGAAAGPEAAAAARRVPLSPEAACLSFAHLLCLLLDARHLALGGLSLQRNFVRYLGCGSTVLCLHYSPATPYGVRMPPRQVALLPEAEEEWLQEEIKQLTEEADEAFDAIEYALGEQLRALQGAAEGEPEPEFAQMWVDTLADTRTSFLDTIQDTITQLDSSSSSLQQSLQGSPGSNAADQEQQRDPEQQQQQASRAVSLVWELNRLRTLLAAIVLQWATCLHEGMPTSHAAVPSGTSALTTALQSRRGAANHSRHGSSEAFGGAGAAAGAGGGAPGAADAELPASPFGQPEQQSLQQEPTASAAGEAPEQQQPTAAHATQQLAPVQMQMQRKDSGASLGRHFLESASAAGLPQRSTVSELSYGAPVLQADDSGSLATSPHGSQPVAIPSSIPTGLVARYVALFDQRGERGGATASGSSSPSGRGAGAGSGSQPRTRDWVQTSAGEGAGAGMGPAAALSSSPAGAATEAGGSGGSGSAGASMPPIASNTARQQAAASQQVQADQEQQPAHRSSLFRLDLTNIDPDLVKALTPQRRSTTEEVEVEAPAVASLRRTLSSSSRLEQLSARLGQMSLAHSFNERRRSHLGGPVSASPLEAVEEPSSQQQQQAQAQGDEGELSTQQLGQATDEGLKAAAEPAAGPQSVAVQAKDEAARGPGGEEEQELAAEPSGQPSVSHFDEWGVVLDSELPAGGTAGASGDAAQQGQQGAAAAGGAPALPAPALPLPLRLLTAASGKLQAIGRLQEAPMPPDLAMPGGLQEASAEPAGSALDPSMAPGSSAEQSQPPSTPAGRGGGAGAVFAAAVGLAAPAAASSAAAHSRAPSLGSRTVAQLVTAAVVGPAGSGGSGAPASPSREARPRGRLMQLLGKLRGEMQPGQLPLTAGKVELSGRALLPAGADGMRVAVFDDEPTSIIAYFLATRQYQDYLQEAVAGILFGEKTQQRGASQAPEPPAAGGGDGGEQGSAAGGWQSQPGTPRGAGGAVKRSSLVPNLHASHFQHQQQQQQGQNIAAEAAAEPLEGPGSQAPAAGAAGPAPAVGVNPGPSVPPPRASSRAGDREELAAEQSGDWQVLFHEGQLDCQLALEDPSPGMPWGRAKFQITAYYAPQFAELRRRCVAGGEPAFLASISRCRKWASRGGKSSAYFARSCDKRYIVKQLSRSERQSFLEFAPDYFRYVATMLHRGQDTCLAKILGVYQVSVQYTGGRGAPSAPPFGGKEGVMDLLITENVFYGRDSQVSRIYDLKGSQRDRYAADNPSVAGAVLLDENLKELNLSSPTLVGPRAFAALQRALWSDTSFLASLNVMDYSLLVGVDRQRQELVVGVIDYIRQYTWDKQVETWVKKSGILGGAGKDPTVISPKQYSKRFRTAMSSYLTVMPSWEAPPPPLDPDAM